MARPPLRRCEPCSRLCLMNWTAILERAGIPDSPGRSQAAAAALDRAARRAAARKGADKPPANTRQRPPAS
jgi:hypothetical protein